MKQQCTYHPTRIAHWHCPKCGKDFCPECVIERQKAGRSGSEFLHLCPKCNVEVSWVGVSNIIDPFWARLPKIFAYPFSFGPLILMLVVTVLTLIITGDGLVSRLLRFAVWGMMLKYSFAALLQTANGNLRPPAITQEVLTDNFDEVFKQFCIYICAFIATFFIILKLGFLAGILFGVFMLISIPAMIIILVSSKQFSQAINPAAFVTLMFRIGWGYLIMCLFLLFLLGAPAVVFQAVFPLMPEKLTLFLTVFSENFYTLVSYHLMGYVVLQYHDRIGYEVEHREFDDPTENLQQTGIHDPEAILLKDVTLLIQEGDLDGAVKAIQQFQKSKGVIKTKMLADRYYELLKLTNQPEEIMTFAGTYLDLLTRENDKKTGIAVYNHCKKIQPDFEPSSSALMKIAGWVGDGKPESSLKVLNKIIKHYPSDPVTPKAYFRAAQIFHDRMMKPEKSREMIQTLMKNYPNSDVIPMAKRYLEGI